MEHLIVQIGLLMAAAAILAVILGLLKQSSIIAFIAVGIIAGLFKHSMHLPHELVEAFTEIGIILLLFMAGLEVDIKSFLKRWKLVLINGMGQIILNTIIGIILAYAFLNVPGRSAAVYYGLCLTFSSTIIVLGTLKAKKEMETLHGQIILGLMVIQDITAVLALSVLKSLSSGGPLLPVIGILFIKMFVLIAVLIVLAKTVLVPLFRYLAKSADMLFVGTLGYALGIAALCELIHFSPEIGAFLAGASLGFLPYKLEIEDKVEPLKSFGVILFFITLGYKLEFTSEILQYTLPIVLSTLVVVLGTPILMLLLGWSARIKSRPAFLIGGTINQISEFSLILATLCLQAGVFDKRIFLIITLSCLGTIFLSSIGHQILIPLYGILKTPLKFIDSHSRMAAFEEEKGFKLKDHVVLLSYNELTETIAEFYARLDRKVLVLVIDPDIHKHLSEKKGNIVAEYADIFDPDVWEEFHFEKASIIISCMIEGQEAELAICRWLREKGTSVPFLAATDSSDEALELYKAGVTYVIQTEDLAAKQFRQVFEAQIVKGRDSFTDIGQSHFESLKKARVERKKGFEWV